ncbi:MAG: sigma-70 family RNA polymerase sigma factor [Planctomycetota bacterium]
MMTAMNNNPACAKAGKRYNEKQVQILVEQFKGGNKKAFAELWSAVMPLIKRILKRGLDEDTAEHLTAQACLRLFENGIYEYEKDKSSFITWVYNTALNLKIDELRRTKPVLFSELSLATGKNGQGNSFDINYLSSDRKDPLRLLIEKEEGVIRQKALELLPRLMERLPPDEQYVIYAGIYDNRTDVEISLILDGDIKGADKYRKMRKRTLNKLGRMFAEHGITKVPLKNV